MLGLLRKDLYNLLKTLKILGAMIVLMTIAMVFTNAYNDLTFALVIILVASMFPVSSLSYDDLVKWDSFALTTPVTRKKLVLSKYLLLFIMVIAGMLISSVMVAIVTFTKNNSADLLQALLPLLGVGAISLLLTLITLPLIYKFGTERIRILSMVAMAIGFGGVAAIMNIDGVQNLHQTITRVIPVAVFNLWPVFLVAVMALLSYISYLVSLKIYRKKEF